eukprot:338398_1
MTPIQIEGDLSGTEDGDKSYASCPSSAPTLVSCGLSAGYHHMEGSYPDPSTGQCVAQNGDGGNGVRAIGLCVSNDYTCTYHNGSQSVGEGDDNPSTVGCTGDKIMTSCSPWSRYSSIEGAYVGTRFQNTTINSTTLCTAHNEWDGNGVWAKGICCEYTGNDGYRLDCKTIWGSIGFGTEWGDSYASCDDGYALWGCSAYTESEDSLSDYYIAPWNVNMCFSEFVGPRGQAVATCCRLYKEPTPEPTSDPTNDPTTDPTVDPTSNPTNDPTTDQQQLQQMIQRQILHQIQLMIRRLTPR